MKLGDKFTQDPAEIEGDPMAGPPELPKRVRCDWCPRYLSEYQTKRWLKKSAGKLYAIPKKFCGRPCAHASQNRPPESSIEYTSAEAKRRSASVSEGRKEKTS